MQIVQHYPAYQMRGPTALVEQKTCHYHNMSVHTGKAQADRLERSCAVDEHGI
jgi:hypothetical protein